MPSGPVAVSAEGKDRKVTPVNFQNIVRMPEWAQCVQVVVECRRHAATPFMTAMLRRKTAEARLMLVSAIMA